MNIEGADMSAQGAQLCLGGGGSPKTCSLEEHFEKMVHFGAFLRILASVLRGDAMRLL